MVMTKEFIVKFPYTLKNRQCCVCGKRFEAGELIYKTDSHAYCKSCFERLLH